MLRHKIAITVSTLVCSCIAFGSTSYALGGEAPEKKAPSSPHIEGPPVLGAVVVELKVDGRSLGVRSIWVLVRVKGSDVRPYHTTRRFMRSGSTLRYRVWPSQYKVTADVIPPTVKRAIPCKGSSVRVTSSHTTHTMVICSIR